MTQEKQANAWSDDPEEKEMLVDSESGGGSQIKHMKFPEGRNVIRIVGRYYPFLETWFNSVQRTAIFSGKSSFVENDPRVVKLREEAKALSDELGKEDKRVKAAWKKAFQFKPRLKYAINVIDRADGQIKIWKFSRTMKEQIMAIIEEHGDPNDYDLIITRTGTKKEDTKYVVAPARDREPLAEEEKQLKPFILSKIFKPTDPDTVKAYMDGKKPERKSEVPADVTADTEVVEKPELPAGLEDEAGDMDLGDI